MMFEKICNRISLFCRYAKLSELKFTNRGANFSSVPVGIVGAPFSKGQKNLGTDLAPDLLRNRGLLKQLTDLGLDIKDYGNVHFDHIADAFFDEDEKLINPLEVSTACKKVSEAVKNALHERRKCVTIGGDHSLGIGTVYGHSLVHDVCVLWIDAHADINTVTTSLSGYMHGMPVSFLIKELARYQRNVKGFEWLKPCVKKSNVAFIGLRDIDPLEKLIMDKENILHFTMRDIDKHGIFEVTQRALEAINPKGDLSLHVSFDVDSVEKLVIPCTGTPVLGGLTIREALCIAEEICHLECFRALDIVEVNPLLGTKEQIDNTLDVTALIIKTFLGHKRYGRAPPDVHEIPLP